MRKYTPKRVSPTEPTFPGFPLPDERKAPKRPRAAKRKNLKEEQQKLVRKIQDENLDVENPVIGKLSDFPSDCLHSDAGWGEQKRRYWNLGDEIILTKVSSGVHDGSGSSCGYFFINALKEYFASYNVKFVDLGGKSLQLNNQLSSTMDIRKDPDFNVGPYKVNGRRVPKVGRDFLVGEVAWTHGSLHALLIIAAAFTNQHSPIAYGMFVKFFPETKKICVFIAKNNNSTKEAQPIDTPDDLFNMSKEQIEEHYGIQLIFFAYFTDPQSLTATLVTFDVSRLFGICDLPPAPSMVLTIDLYPLLVHLFDLMADELTD
jgi:hypothetical protein